MPLLSSVPQRKQLRLTLTIRFQNYLLQSLVQKLQNKRQALEGNPIKTPFLLNLPKQEQRLGSPIGRLSSYPELSLQVFGTIHHAFPLAGNTDNNGRQKLEGLSFS
jgi:hypothetical protein